MKKSYSYALSSIVFAALFLTGCGNDSDISVGTATQAGVPGSVAGSEIVINPLIKFNADGLTFSYDNTLATDSQLPTGSINGTFTTSENDGTGELTLTLSATGFTDDLVLVLSGFMDDGSDGLIDTFSYEATYGAVSTGGSGEFTGGKPANPDVDLSSIPDVSGAPTVDEWNQHNVGKNAFFISSGADPDPTFVDIMDSGHFAATDDDGDTEYGTYTYKKLTDTTGELTIREEDGTGWHWDMVATLTFDDFFSSAYQETYNIDTYADGTTDSDGLDNGRIRIFTDASLLSD